MITKGPRCLCGASRIQGLDRSCCKSYRDYTDGRCRVCSHSRACHQQPKVRRAQMAPVGG